MLGFSGGWLVASFQETLGFCGHSVWFTGRIWDHGFNHGRMDHGFNGLLWFHHVFFFQIWFYMGFLWDNAGISVDDLVRNLCDYLSTCSCSVVDHD